jgi:hypothetical protein
MIRRNVIRNFIKKKKLKIFNVYLFKLKYTFFIVNFESKIKIFSKEDNRKNSRNTSSRFVNIMTTISKAFSEFTFAFHSYAR